MRDEKQEVAALERPSKSPFSSYRTAFAGCVCFLAVVPSSCKFHEDCHCPAGSGGGLCPAVADAALPVQATKDAVDDSRAGPLGDGRWEGETAERADGRLRNEVSGLLDATVHEEVSFPVLDAAETLDTLRPGEKPYTNVLDSAPEVRMAVADAPAVSWVDDCDGTVGRYEGSGVLPPATAAFERAYLQYFPQLGCPYNNNGGIWVHIPCAGIPVQDFVQTDDSRKLSSNGQSMLILNSGLSRAFLLYDEIWHAYACMGAGVCATAMGGLALLGPPTTDRYADGVAIRQDFQRGWMTMNAAGTEVTVHLKERQAVDLSGCGGRPPVITFETAVAPDAAAKDGPVLPNSCSQSLVFENPEPRKNRQLTEPSCSLDANGSLILQYSDLQCPAGTDPYWGCAFMDNHDMLRFDPDSNGNGVYEILFCIDGPLNGAVNVWYEPAGSSESRRFLPLFPGGGYPVAPGCRRVYIGPGDVNRGAPSKQSHCTSAYSGEPSCIGRQATDALVASAPTAPTAPPFSAFDASAADTVVGMDAPDFRKSKLVLMNEWCDPKRSLSSSTTPVTITLVSVTYHPSECLCREDSQCQPGSSCRRVSWSQDSCCQCDCPGFCQ